MKKIAIVISDLVLGGGQRSALNLAAALSKDHEVSVIVFQDSYRQYDVPCRIINIECPDKESVVSKALNIFKRTWRLKKIFKAEQFDFVFSFMESANFVTSLACKKAILSVHCNPHELNSYEAMLMRITYPRAKHIVAVSEDVATLLREDFNMQNVSRIYNLVSFTDIQEQGAIPYQHKRPFIVALGRLNEVKRLDLLVAAYAESKLKGACDLLLIGEGEKRPELEAQIVSLSLEDKVILTGVRSNPFEYLAAAEFLVLSSRTEAFPMVLIEALALSCPVVATDCPTGPREIVIHGKNGLLVENGSQSELTLAMDRLFEDKALLAECRMNALQSVDHLSADHVTKEWLALGD